MPLYQSPIIYILLLPFVAERIGVFEPEVEEARGASSIAIVVGGLMAFICVLIILSDAPVIMKTLKGEIPQHKRKAKFIHNRQTTFF